MQREQRLRIAPSCSNTGLGNTQRQHVHTAVATGCVSVGRASRSFSLLNIADVCALQTAADGGIEHHECFMCDGGECVSRRRRKGVFLMRSDCKGP